MPSELSSTVETAVRANVLRILFVLLAVVLAGCADRGARVASTDLPTSISEEKIGEPTLVARPTRRPTVAPSATAVRLPTATPTPPSLANLLSQPLPPSGSPLGDKRNPLAAQALRLPTPTPSPTTFPLASVTTDLVNVRSGPGAHYAIIGQLRAGQKVDITGRNETSDWWEICCPTGEETPSWVIGQFVDIAMPAGMKPEMIAVADIPPAPESADVALGGTGGASPAALAAAPAPGIPGTGNFGPPGGVNPLTGLSLPAELAAQRPVIVCINNDYAARPQFGLGAADVVYEYLMEGYGITRFSAIFYGENASQIGPVRSARLINYYMGALYDAGLACSGASDRVRYALKHESPFPYMDIDLDDPSNLRYSVSIGSDYRTRLRTGVEKLHRWLADWSVERPANLRGFTFGETPPGGEPAGNIEIPYPAATGSQSSYQFDPGSGRYLRRLGGGAHVDGNTGVQLSLANVIVQFVPHETTDIVEDSLGSTSIGLNLFGSERALVFRDGHAYEATWRSESRGDMPRFYDAAGQEIALKQGHTWISVVPLNYAVTYD